MEEMLELSAAAVMMVAGGADDATSMLLGPNWPVGAVLPMLGTTNYPYPTMPNPPR